MALCLASGCAMVAAAVLWGDASSPRPELARLAQQGRLEGVTIEYWVGGGLPPPWYRSDQFRLLTLEGQDALEFARPYRDPAQKLAGLVEKFQLAAQPSEVRKLAQLIIDTGVFEQHFPEEKDPGRADALTTEVSVTAGGREFKRRYFTGSPKPLEPLRAEVQRLIQRLVASGKRQVLHQGKPVALPAEPSREDRGEAEPPADTIPLANLAEEVSRRIDRRLAAKGKLVLLIDVSSDASSPAYEMAKTLQRTLGEKRGLALSTKSSAGGAPVPSGTPAAPGYRAHRRRDERAPLRARTRRGQRSLQPGLPSEPDPPRPVAPAGPSRTFPRPGSGAAKRGQPDAPPFSGRTAVRTNGGASG